MGNKKTSLICILELFSAGFLLALALLLIDYICPVRIFNLLPEKIIGEALEPSGKDIKALDQLVRDGKIMSPKDLYEHLIEYYHVLFTMIFAVLGAVVALVYIQIRKSEHVASIETAQKIDKQIESLNISQKIDEQIALQNLSEKIDNAILQEGLSETLLENILANQTLRTYIEEQLEQKMATFSEETNSRLEAALSGLEKDLERVKAKLEMESN